jgi:hypothetical protein
MKNKQAITVIPGSVINSLSLRPPSRNPLINAFNRRGLRVKPAMTKESELNNSLFISHL